MQTRDGDTDEGRFMSDMTGKGTREYFRVKLVDLLICGCNASLCGTVHLSKAKLLMDQIASLSFQHFLNKNLYNVRIKLCTCVLPQFVHRFFLA